MALTLSDGLESRNAFEHKKARRNSNARSGSCHNLTRSRHSLPQRILPPSEPIAGPSVTRGAHHSSKSLDRRQRRTSPHNEVTPNVESRSAPWKVRVLGSGTYGKIYRTKIYRDGSSQATSDAVLKVVRLDKYPGSFTWQVRAELEALKRIREHPPKRPCLIEQPADVEESELTWWCRENASLYMLFKLYCTDWFAVIDYNHRVESRPVPSEYVKNMAYEMVSGLNHIHSLGIIHRDIKPENIFVDHRGHCRIGDFGGAVVLQDLDEDGDPEPVHGRYFCSNFNPMLTAAYSPPESVIPVKRKGQKVFVFNESLDFWSLGVIIYLSVCGQTRVLANLVDLLEEKERNILACFMAFEEMVQELKVSTGVDPDVKEFIVRCCRILPQERITGKEARRVVKEKRWRFRHSDRYPDELRKFLPPKEVIKSERCTCHNDEKTDSDPSKAPPPSTPRGGDPAREFAELLSRTPVFSIRERLECETRLEVRHEACLVHHK
ncbi:hypothetical protein GALMADRAFT_241351 [Galerina marginata CBS 339.88]|uniref:Protein kinase domain-containing protein n=1 Tax=Galerina marginata (strain CBS 339.88) TaxID=685588 RepID=A0A067TLT8_GALM3|nr:hypothetical protein GALMADRAFT_241351 [Galerina marginata CBS 339.88]